VHRLGNSDLLAVDDVLMIGTTMNRWGGFFRANMQAQGDHKFRKIEEYVDPDDYWNMYHHALLRPDLKAELGVIYEEVLEANGPNTMDNLDVERTGNAALFRTGPHP
jgi:hypothetical protein